MSAPQVPSDEGVAEMLVRFFTTSARTDLGLDPTDPMVPAGQVFADALRCRLMVWCDGTDDRTELVALVHERGATLADLIEGAGRA